MYAKELIHGVCLGIFVFAKYYCLSHGGGGGSTQMADPDTAI